MAFLSELIALTTEGAQAHIDNTVKKENGGVFNLQAELFPQAQTIESYRVGELEHCRCVKKDEWAIPQQLFQRLTPPQVHHRNGRPFSAAPGGLSVSREYGQGQQSLWDNTQFWGLFRSQETETT